MKLFKCFTIEQYQEFADYLADQDQPLYIYKSEDRDGTFLVSEIEVIEIEIEISKILDNQMKTKINPDLIINDDDPVFDYSEDSDDDFLMMLR